MKRFSCVSISVPFFILFSIASVASCYWMTWQNHDFIHQTSYPYVSDLGNAYPQSILFRVAFSALTIYLFYITSLRLLQLWTAFPSRMQPFLVMFAALYSGGYMCVVLLAYFNNRDYQSPHLVFAGGAFCLLVAFQIEHSTLCFLLAHEPYVHLNKCINRTPEWVLIYNCVCNVISVCAAAMVVIFPDHDVGTINESILIFTVLVYFLPWVVELQPCTLPNLASAVSTAHLFRDVSPINKHGS